MNHLSKMRASVSDEGDDVVGSDVASDPSLMRAPSSPSNSWSSAETMPLPADSPVSADGEHRRPKRCKISRDQLAVLISSFEEEPLPNFDQRQALAKHLGMTPRSVQIWFQNRRQRLKPMQPKAAAIGTPLCPTMAHSSAGRPGGSGQGSQPQHIGMPGLAAAAGLCNGAGGGFESLVMSHAMSQLGKPMHAAAPGMTGYTSSLPYDVMEPFAATKALLGAGYQAGAAGFAPGLSQSPLSQAVAGGAVPPCSALPPAATGMGMPGMAGCSPHEAQLLAQQISQPHRAASNCSGVIDPGATPRQSDVIPGSGSEQKADGLLLLLACADGRSAEHAVAS